MDVVDELLLIGAHMHQEKNVLSLNFDGFIIFFE